MAEPKRIQRRRTKGWRMPENAVYVGRPSDWGNPHREGDVDGIHFMGISRAEAVERFARDVESDADRIADIRFALRGKDLACWCPLDKPCHADVLLRIAND